jgi:hypothetical protein
VQIYFKVTTPCKGKASESGATHVAAADVGQGEPG